MMKKLREELIKLSTEIITAKEDVELVELYNKARIIYEKLAVLKFIEEKLNDVQVDVSKNVVASRFEKVANAVLSGNTSVPESNPHEEDIMTPGMDTIKDIVSEMPTEMALDQIFAEFVAKPDFMKNDKENLAPLKEDIKQGQANLPKSLNDKLGKDFQIGLNDKLAFVKHLFNNSMEDYTRVLSQLNTIDTEERSIAFINNMVKPEYNNWEGKEEYETRLITLIERRFA
ncbi:hypothetical protein SAMN04487891_101423 [Flagellimonas taeanensis]|jgi:hypothetical protein|uniref:Uncharacterized protein n=2 Tax=Flagellimonas taeanensis TaxID=1005926 RepID=A0A1M6Q321_9FLAO|nr:hypothetical protein [Allomuricauda taeanensis]MEE1961505.1 hypothetical protein [Allomuricauda taeanensis]SFB68925.1 hypothetical protein SAMN04487891_101423 [Allomuricauda taeanensis]SHK14624.1 hypothetical protein SAMN05216293_0430 [Allomuricauda taeanensis]